MPQDHYVAKTYLKAFADPATIKDPEKGGQIHAYHKRDGKYFLPFADGVCKSLNWDTTEKYLSPPDALGQWLKIFEPNWPWAIDRLSTTHHLSSVDKFIIAGYWAYLSTCTPTWQRVATDLQQAELEKKHLEDFLEYAQANPDKFPKAKDYIPLVKDGTLKPTIDKNYPKAIVTMQLPEHQWCLYHQEWNVIFNKTGEHFLTSDNPSCFDYEHGTAIHPARFLPLSPTLALWTNIEMNNIPRKIDPTLEPARKSIGRKATVKFVKQMNITIIKCAENFVLSSEKKAYIPVCIKKYCNWAVSREQQIRIPCQDGYYEVIQTRARPKAS